MSKEAMKLALKELETWKCFTHGKNEHTNKAIKALEEALAKQEQGEPVAYGMRDTMIGNGNRMMYVRLDKGQDGCTVPLYTTPYVPTGRQQRIAERKPLTDEQKLAIERRWNGSVFQLIEEIEAAHGIKE